MKTSNSFTSRIAQRLMNTRLGREIVGQLAASPITDNNFFPTGMSDNYRDRFTYDRGKIQQECLRAWRINPLARRIVNLISQFVIGKGVSYVCILANINQQPPNATYWGLAPAQGATGPTGAQGNAGAQGASGAKGDPGAQGAKGDQGDPGPTITIGSPANGLALAGGELTIGLATSSQPGALSATDWNAFNAKLEDGTLRDVFNTRVYPFIKNFDNLDGFTPYHIGTGSFTGNWPTGYLGTGDTINSIGRFYSNLGFSLFNLDPTNNLRWKQRLYTNSTVESINHEFWFGFHNQPWYTPFGNYVHIAFKVLNGTIYASSFNGVNTHLESTGVTFQKWHYYNLEIRQNLQRIDYYVNSVLTNTFTTDIPDAVYLLSLHSVANTAAGDITLFLFPLIVEQGE